MNVIIDKETRFTEIYERFGDGVYKFILSMIGDYDDSNDIFQNVFTKIYEKIESLNDERNVKSYIFTITKNKTLDYLKSRKSHTIDIESAKELCTQDPDINLLLDLNKAVETLFPREKEIFEMKYFFGYKIIEIANILNISEGAVKRYLFDATYKIRDILK
ncbi:MAG: RNA polymerase sigma factor [Candidatus Hydrogenedentota bacterium]